MKVKNILNQFNLNLDELKAILSGVNSPSGFVDGSQSVYLRAIYGSSYGRYRCVGTVKSIQESISKETDNA